MTIRYGPVPNTLARLCTIDRNQRGLQNIVLVSIFNLTCNDLCSLCSLDVEIWKLPCFDVEIPTSCLRLWSEKYSNYRCEMTEVLKSAGETKNDAANAVIKKYKQLLYGDMEFEESERRIEDVYNDALAIYHLAYDHAKTNRNIKNCGFAWKVAGPALFKFYITRQSEKSVKPIFCSPSVLREVLN